MKYGEEVQQEKLVIESNKIAAIILSRYSSSRLPGKALLEINNKKVLSYIIERLQLVLDTSNILIATSNDISDDRIEEFAKKEGIKCFRGSLNNVAERFLLASKSFDCDFAIRINGDNIFLEIDLLNEMINIALTNKYDFISNVPERTFPRGMSIEIVRVSFFESMQNEIQKNDEFKEHVTLALYKHYSNKFHFVKNTKTPEAANMQLALDNLEDLNRTKYIVSKFNKSQIHYDMKSILEILKNYHAESI